MSGFSDPHKPPAASDEADGEPKLDESKGPKAKLRTGLRAGAQARAAETALYTDPQTAGGNPLYV